MFGVYKQRENPVFQCSWILYWFRKNFNTYQPKLLYSFPQCIALLHNVLHNFRRKMTHIILPSHLFNFPGLWHLLACEKLLQENLRTLQVSGQVQTLHGSMCMCIFLVLPNSCFNSTYIVLLALCFAMITLFWCSHQHFVPELSLL